MKSTTGVNGPKCSNYLELNPLSAMGVDQLPFSTYDSNFNKQEFLSFAFEL